MNNKNIITGAIVVGIAVACFIAYQGIVAIPQERIASFEEKQRLDRLAEVRAEELKQIKYDACMRDAYKQYSSNWDTMCKANKLEADCTMKKYLSDPVEEKYTKSQSDCLTRFK